MVHVSIVEREGFDSLRLQHNFLGKMVFQAVYMHVADYDKTVLRRHEDDTLSVCVIPWKNHLVPLSIPVATTEEGRKIADQIRDLVKAYKAKHK